MGVDRAYIYFFNDADEPQLHAASGLTRNYVPKPAFHAVAHLQRALGEYRFARVIAQEPEKLMPTSSATGGNGTSEIWAVWSPTGSNRQAEAILPAFLAG